MANTRNDPPYPDLDPWELHDFERRFRAAIGELETAWRTGALRALLREPRIVAAVGPEVLAAYRRLPSRLAARRDPRRRPSVENLLHKLVTDALRITCWGDLRACSDGRFVATTPNGTSRVLRRDQLDAARFWGMGFVLADVDAHAALVRDQVWRSVREFAGSLSELRRILRRRSAVGISMVPSHAYRRFEQIVVDILNEDSCSAERAPLAEDFCQATDLRVRYPDLARKRGARVQVKAAANLGRHEAWLRHTAHRDLLVIVSPVTLATAMESAPLVAPHREVWSCLGRAPEDCQQLAYALREQLFAGLPTPHRDPAGPMAAVPGPVRALLRSFVRRGAFRSTAQLRRREAERGRYRTGRDGRIIWTPIAAG